MPYKARFSHVIFHSRYIVKCTYVFETVKNISNVSRMLEMFYIKKSSIFAITPNVYNEHE